MSKNQKDPKRSASAKYHAALRKLASDKQRQFVKRYLIHFNATRAMREAGYSANGANATGSQNLAKPPIRNAVDLGIKAMEEAAGVTPERIERELARVAFSDMRDFAEWNADGFTLRESKELDDEHSPALQQFTDKRGDSFSEIGIKLHDKKWALEMLAKRHRYFERAGESSTDSDDYVLTVRRKQSSDVEGSER